MRILCIAPPEDHSTAELVTALLREGHAVRAVAPPPPNLLSTWNPLAFRPLGRASSAFKPELIYERHRSGRSAGAWLARRTQIRFFLALDAPPEEPIPQADLLLVPSAALREKLDTSVRIEIQREAAALERFLPAPFRPDTPPTVLAFGPQTGREHGITVHAAPHPDRLPDQLAGDSIALHLAATPELFACMAAGCAIVAPDQPDIREILAHEATALLFDPEAEPWPTVARLLAEPALRARLAAAARAELERHDYTWRGNARRLAAWAQQ